MNTFFRKAEITDRERILEIYDHILDEEEKGPKICGWRRGFYPTPDVADAGIESGEMIVLEADGLVVGSARFNKIQDEVFYKAKWQHDAPEEEVLVLHTLTVDPLCKGHGYGKMILAYYEELARKMNCTELRMDTGGTNSRARKIYADMGFIEADALEYSYTEKPEDIHKVIFLEKYIGA